MERMSDADYVKACTRLVVEGKAPIGTMRKILQNTLSADMRLLKVDARDVQDRKKRKAMGRLNANPAASGTPP